MTKINTGNNLKVIQKMWNKVTLSTKYELIRLMESELGGFLNHDLQHVNATTVWTSLTRKEQRALQSVINKITNKQIWTSKKLSVFIELGLSKEERLHLKEQIKIYDNKIKKLTLEWLRLV